ncbi:AEC family transporter [Kocuria tytonicola]|uniref:AEC family transporter n=1 Tax=Kocuria tytonicola TaxID=2055946 RepID=A0A3L9L5G1_9MICC|nr:AEC family transporter [Kocuria tytonicola]RLY94223.1 AEC family transporter [Kocuria tytonicola]
MAGVLSGFFIVWAVIGLGYLVGRTGVLGADAQQVLSRLAFYVGSPPLLFTTLAQADVRHVFSAPLLVAAGSAWLTMLAYGLLSRFVLARDASTVVMGAQAAGQVNAANLGIPIALFVLGDASRVAPVMLFQLALNTPLYLTVMDTLTGGHRPTVGSVLRGIGSNPLIVGSALGIMSSTTGLTPPDLVMEPVRIVAGAAVPAMLIAFGISLVGTRPLSVRGARADTLLATGAKVVLHPLLALVLARVLGLEGSALYAAVVMGSLPTAQNLYVAAVRYDRATTVCRDTVLLTTVTSVLSMTVVAVFLS